MTKHYHLIGIGGIGMSGIAHLLLANGFKVSGSDIKETKITQFLRSQGAQIFIGHNAEHIKQADVVVYSSAIKEDNPELVAAHKKNLLVIHRAQALAMLMRNKTVVAVSGSHGKTTTASLASFLLLEAGLTPTIAVGGIIKNIGKNAEDNKGEFFVAEADESDGSFLFYEPTYTIITNVDREHLDYYRDFEQLKKAYADFIEKTASSGIAICCADDVTLNLITEHSNKKIITYSIEKKAPVYATNIKFHNLTSEFDCYYKEKLLGHFHLALGGRHNVSNALAVIALGMELGISFEIISRTLSSYKGTARRLEVKFENSNLIILDDYAHHPTEISATISAVRNLNFKRLVVVFQPHRFSRTKILLSDFGYCFKEADVIVLTDIYPAHEQPIDGINAQVVALQIKNSFPEKDVFVVSKEKLSDFVYHFIIPGDCILFLGAGDIVKISDELVQRIKLCNSEATFKQFDYV
ncbi:MAG: UDP-N-acetylmuramate--L-alanine ligase [Candidatus Omnitrophica bacterium]|nr:UDP-N-acetylmuramate--L-alanine ligase [Candidatus Omnitrophota bacterium]